jgi:hypothetical protein
MRSSPLIIVKATSSGEKSDELATAEKKLEDRDYASTSDRREMVTVAMRDGFAKAPRWEHEASGPSPEAYWSAFANSSMASARASAP